MMRMVDVIWCVDKARWKRETYRVSLIHPLETNNSQAYKNMIWSKWVIKIRFCLTGASSSIDPTIPPLTSSLCCCNEFLPFLAFHQFPCEALWQNQIKVVQIIPRDKFVIKSLSDAFSDVLMWRGREGGRREGTSDTGQRTQKYRCSGHVQSNIIVPNYSPTLSPLSPPPHPPGAQCGWAGFLINILT